MRKRNGRASTFSAAAMPAPFRGVQRVSIRELQRHYWRILRQVWRKGWKVEITQRRGGNPIAILVPYDWYQETQKGLAAAASACGL